MKNMILINLLITSINLYKVKNKPITLIYYTYSIVELFITFYVVKFSIKMSEYQNAKNAHIIIIMNKTSILTD